MLLHESMCGHIYRALVYNAARDGNLRRLKIFLEGRSAEWLNSAFEGDPDRAPPIVVAARNGHVDVVRYLIKKGADVSVTGTVTFDGETVSGSPALWAAAAAGHYGVVECLVNEGCVDINQPTLSDSTPLRGACYDGHLRIVKFLVEGGADIERPNRHGHTPLMIASFRRRIEVVEYLLSKGADPRHISPKGNTALHDAAESGSVEICERLIEAGAENVADDDKITPLLSAAIAGHGMVVHLLCKTASGSQARDALKLYGATLVDKKVDLGNACRVWKQAVMFGTPLNDRKSYPVYDNLVEIDSESDVNAIIGDPDAIRMQALIVRERVLGTSSRETHHYIRYRGAVYCDLGQLEKCIQLWLHVLSLQKETYRPLSPSTIETYGSFLDAFMLTVNEGVIHRDNDRNIRFVAYLPRHVLIVLDKAVSELEEFERSGSCEYCTAEDIDETQDIATTLENFMLIALQLSLLTIRAVRNIREISVKVSVLKETQFWFKNIAERLVSVCKHLSLCPLHAAVVDTDKMVTSRFPSRFVIGMLLECGVDVNAMDKQRNTPLHKVLLSDTPRLSIVKFLLDHGAALLARNADDQTCLELIASRASKLLNHIKLGQYITLFGLAANVVNRSNLPSDYLRYLPTDLIHDMALY
ncbi:hypothetical protein AB6A40_000829 [Gnathostoma spinigerum]|uniref:Sex-determining protein fem-1 n=1 Tax=Gnathostoma spinigerum TaxID=75299 RepID=A0ABD6E2U7_9BILA